jgi:heme exporter protein D
MDSVHEFLAMGGYAAYVWPAYGAAAVILVGLVVASRRKLRAAQRSVALLEAAGKRRGGDGVHP